MGLGFRTKDMRLHYNVALKFIGTNSRFGTGTKTQLPHTRHTSNETFIDGPRMIGRRKRSC
jgi:hypothetical protein